MTGILEGRPIRILNGAAPIRICDNGGWTDTWFAEHGKIFNIAVSPYVQVQIEVHPSAGDVDRIVINAENYGERYVMGTRDMNLGGRYPLVEGVIKCMDVPKEYALNITIFSETPGGASTGTSAAVAVALIGALNCLRRNRLSIQEISSMAHSVEMDGLKQQSGIQDQICSAYGGLNFIEMRKYPHAHVSPISVSDSTWWELESCLALIYLGKSHSSTAVHERVIETLKGEGPDCKKLSDLRVTAEKSRDAVCAGDFLALGCAMIENTEAQGRLHPDLISRDAHRVIDIARAHGALGWKVNGAGGDGGSLTILCGSRASMRRSLIREIEQENQLFKNIPIHLSRDGLRVWEVRKA